MLNPYYKLIFRLIFSAVLCVLLLVNFSGIADRKADVPLAASFERALITYGVVRGINAVVSVIQGTELAIEPAGIGVILKPGEVFDPINDLIERFSVIVLVASTSLGAQRILLSMGETTVVQVAVAIALVVQLALLWRSETFSQTWRALLFRLSVLTVVLRFLIPVLVLLNDRVYDAFLDEQFQESYSELERTEAEVRALQESETNEIETDENDGIFDQIGRFYDRTTQNINVSARLTEYENRLANTSERIIELIVVFILQTLIFPLLFLWLGLKLARILVATNLLAFFAHSSDR